MHSSQWVCELTLPCEEWKRDIQDEIINIFFIWWFLCVLVLRTRVNMMFVILLWVCIHTGQVEKFAWSPTRTDLTSYSSVGRTLLSCSVILVDPKVAGSVPTVVRQTFQLAQCDICDVTLSVYPHRASLKNMPGHGGNRTYDLWNTSPMLCQLSYAVRVTSQT